MVLICKEYPLALYLHCASHCLNLAVVKSLESQVWKHNRGYRESVPVLSKHH